jgi:hypothetical protein
MAVSCYLLIVGLLALLAVNDLAVVLLIVFAVVTAVVTTVLCCCICFIAVIVGAVSC